MTRKRRKKDVQDFDEDTSGRDILEVQGVDGWTVFHWMLKEWNGREWDVLSGSEYEPNVGCFESGNRFSGSKGRGIFSTC